MFRTSLSIIAALAAALTIGSLTAHAAKNDGRFEQSGEAKRAKFCSDLKDSYNVNMSYYKENPSKRGRWKMTADNLKTLAEGNNCSWAS